MTETEKKKKVVFLGKLPPPFIGPAVATKIILNSELKDKFDIIHLDTSDHRDINTLGKFDLINIFLQLKHYFLLFWMLAKHRPEMVYVPSAQTTVGYLRDIPYILIIKLFRKKVICHLRGGNFRNWFESRGKMMKWLVRRIQKKIDGQIVLGDNLRYMFKRLMPDEKIFVVPNGGNFKFNHIPKNEEKILVLFLSNFIRSKGVLDVLFSTKLVFEKISQVEFIFSGHMRDKQTEKELKEFLEKNPRIPIRITGPVAGKEKFA